MCQNFFTEKYNKLDAVTVVVEIDVVAVVLNDPFVVVETVLVLAGLLVVGVIA